jgi:hypothetical protein
MWGAWGISAQLPSERIVVSDRVSGLFVFDFDRDLFETIAPYADLLVFPNPLDSESPLTVRLPEGVASSFSIRIVSAMGAVVHQSEIDDQTYVSLNLDLAAGCYTLEVGLNNSFDGTVYRKNIIIN